MPTSGGTNRLSVASVFVCADAFSVRSGEIPEEYNATRGGGDCATLIWTK